MRNKHVRWLGALGVMVSLGAVVVVGGPGSALAEEERADHNDRAKNPFTQILKKLNDILATLKSAQKRG